MHLVKPTILKVFISITLVASVLLSHAQENSPYSRYGLGDLVPNQNITSKGMGGISAAYIDVQSAIYPNLQSYNPINPASLGYLSKYNFNNTTFINRLNLIFDIGAEVDWRTLRNTAQAKKFTSVNSLFSYMSLAFPVSSQKMSRKGINGAMAVGIKPVSRINYKIAKTERRPGIDSLYTLYEGNGGANQAYVSTGWRFLVGEKRTVRQSSIGVGFTTGYTFGTKNYGTRINFLNDTVIYAASNHATESNFGGLALSGGLQFEKQLKDTLSAIRFGVYGSMQRTLNTHTDTKRETFTYDANLNELRVDSVFENNNVAGKATYPATLGAGFTYQNVKWLIGADYELTNWKNFRYNGIADALQNNWMVRVGTQYSPKSTRKYLSQGRYRAGFYYGPDYVISTGTSKPYYAFTAGLSLPITSPLQLNYGNYASFHSSMEIGSRGNKQTNLREGFVRFSFGVTMNARWFQKPKYD